jgi:ABC-2 type transport system permease protein
MNRARVAALTQVETLYVRRLAIPPLVYLALPFVLMAFLRNGVQLFFRSFGYPGANGSEFVVPAQATLFGYMVTEHACLWVYAEHSWKTWNRIRATPTTTAEVMTAKALFWGGYIAIQYVILFVGGGLIFGLHVAGSIPALVVLMAVTVATTIAFGFCGLALCQSQAAHDAWTYGGALLLAAVGGGITPGNLLPGWAKHISPGSPIYWTLKGTRAVILDGGGFSAVVRPCLVLLAFATGLALVGAWRFDPQVAKTGRAR